MVARRLWTPVGEAEISGDGYGPDGQVRRHGQPVAPAADSGVTGLLSAARSWP